MPTTTPRLGLLKKTDGEYVDVTTDLAENWDKIDEAINGTLCTSGTRPATPWTGQRIIETDTLKELLWDGSQWVIWGGKVPSCIVRKTSNQSIATTTGVQITLDSLDSNYLSHSSDFELDSNSLKFKKPGFYMVHGAISWAATANTGSRKGYIFYNADAVPFISVEVDKAATNIGNSLHMQRILRVANVDDYVRLFGYQASGSNLNCIGADTGTIMGTCLEAHWIRPL